MSEYTTLDVRDLDCAPLGKVAGSHYYEQRLILKVASDGTRAIVGTASAWPLIKLQAQNTELTELLSATLHQASEAEQQAMQLGHDLAVSEQCRIDSECHVAELTTRIGTFEAHIAALEACLNEIVLKRQAPPPQMPPAAVEQAEAAFIASIRLLEAPDDGLERCNLCDRAFKNARALGTHQRRTHGQRAETPAVIEEALALPERPAAIALELGEAPWRCAICGDDGKRHARSISDPTRCMRCLTAHADLMLTNGHHVAA